MTAIVITKNSQGKLEGIDQKGQRAYAKWRRLVTDLEPGQTLTFSYRMPRSPAHHRLFFLKLNRLLDRTEAFDDLDKLRYWLVMGAGYCDFVPGIEGKPNAIPKSLDFTQMDETEFAELHRQVNTFLWTSRAQETLWPHLDAEGRYRCVEEFLREFE
jgi:Protein of unknown function (DUF1367)